jgi:tRNA(Ile2) C34 agmatinyltransferase TiaS
MQLLVAIDDTDDLDSELGTGKVSRRLAARLAAKIDGIDRYGSVRQQLLVDPRVPYTTHNSAACLLFDCATEPAVEEVVALAAEYLETVQAPNADPGLCVGFRTDVTDAVRQFGESAQNDVLEKADAYTLADDVGLFLDEYGGTGDGVIGALAAVGLTWGGDTGRFIAFEGIREFEGTVEAAAIRDVGITLVTDDGREIRGGSVETHDWIRPQLRGGNPVLPVERTDRETWIPRNVIG